jgi:glycine/D-amino acid oxidase-like deaminating enzyme
MIGIQAKPRVAILGAGIMGSSAALFLARAGCAVTLIDQAASAMSGASRWNEGKIHLGFLYAGDPSCGTAVELVTGGLAFRPLTEDLIGCSLASATTPDDDIYLVHPESVVDAEAMAAYFQRVEALIASHAEKDSYLAPFRRVERLDRHKIESLTNGTIRAGFYVPERSVNTVWVADRFVDALATEPHIALRLSTFVVGAESIMDSWNGPWKIRCEPQVDDQFDFVVNALWEGRLAVDSSLGLVPEAEWSHRFRLSLFVETAGRLDLPCLVLATGPFGDVKNYDGHHFYLSWYPAGLVAQGDEIEPPQIPTLPPETAMAESIRQGLTAVVPPVQTVFDNAKDTHLGGGWVFAIGRGSLDDPTASLHRRDRFGVRRMGTFFSVDTGKYSMAPWLARRIANQILFG